MHRASLCRRPRFILLLIWVGIPFKVIGSPTSEAEPELRHQVEQSLDYIANKVFDNCIIEMSNSCGVTESDGGTIHGIGTVTFAHFGKTVLIDRTALSQVTFEGRTNEVTQNEQHSLAEKGFRLNVEYEPIKAEKKAATVSFDPELNYEKQYLALVEQVPNFRNVLGRFGPHDSTLRDLVRSPPDTIRVEGNGVVGSYRTDYGVTTVKAARIGSQYVPMTVSLLQVRDDVFDYHSSPNKLLATPFFKGYPSGLDSCTDAMVFRYRSDVSPPQLQSLSLSATVNAGQLQKRYYTELTVRNYRKCTSERGIEALRVPIPDGTTVITADEKYQGVDLMWKDGAVVRRVDGKAVGLLARRSRMNISRWLAAVGGSVTGILLIVWLGLRYKRSTPKGIDSRPASSDRA